MAVIGRIRKHYWLLVLVIGIALLLFVLSDFQRKGSSHETTIANIAGEKIGIMEFNRKVDENIELQKNQSGKNNLTTEETNQIRQSTYQQIVNEIVMNKQYEEIGVAVSADELNDLITGNNPHPYIQQSFTNPQTGVFDKQAVLNFLQQLDQVDPQIKHQYLMMEKEIKKDRLNSKYMGLIGKGFYVPTAIAKRNFEETNTMADILVSGIRYMSIPDTAVTVTDADYQKFYDENKYKYVQDFDTRSLKYVVFSPQVSEEDDAKLQTIAQDAYTSLQQGDNVMSIVNSISDTRYDSSWKTRGSFSPRVDSMLFAAPVGHVFEPILEANTYKVFKLMDRQTRPDSLRASHILISYQGSAVRDAKRTKDEAIRVSDSVFSAVKGNAGNFESIATAMSEDNGSKEKGGDLDWFTDGAMVPEFNNAVVKGNIGDIVKVESVFGYHIIKITGKKSPTTKIKVAEVNIQREPGIKSIEKAYNEASTFASENKSFEKFEENANHLNMRTYERVTPNDQALPGMTGGREVVRWSFDKKRKIGDVSNVFDIDGNYVVAGLKDKVGKGTIPLSSLKEALTSLVTREKKAELLIENINKEFATNKDIHALQQKFPEIIIDTANVSFASGNIPNYGFEPTLVGNIFSSSPEQLNGPIKGEQAVYAYILKNITKAPETNDFTMQKRQLGAFFQGRLNNVHNILQEKANIKDNRILFF